MGEADALFKIAGILSSIHEKMERFVAHLDKSSRDNDKWLEGRVTIDARTHMVLLEAVQKLSGQFDKWFELQTKPTVLPPAQQLLNDVSEALTAAVDVQDARKMGEELRELVKPIKYDNSPGDYSDRVLVGLDEILKRYGYGP